MTEQFGLSEESLTQIRHVFAQHPEVSEVLIYGSRAMGTEQPGSDIDLALKGKIPFSLLQDIADQLEELPLPFQFDLSVYSDIENPELIAHIGRVGQVFYSEG